MKTREIKFRAWLPEKQEMCNVTTIGYGDRGYGMQILWIDTHHHKNVPYHSVVLMQFTGLHDKNGKEIYEGDIFQYKSWHKGDDGFTELSDRNSFMKKEVVEYKTKNPFVGFTILSNSEVIGNIYEHPNLLTP